MTINDGSDETTFYFVHSMSKELQLDTQYIKIFFRQEEELQRKKSCLMLRGEMFVSSSSFQVVTETL